MDHRLLKAAMSGNSNEMKHLILLDANILLGTTPQGSTCLHISSILGRQEFSMTVLALNNSLLSRINSYGETPLVVATTNGHVSLASAMLKQYQQLKLSEMILKEDNNGSTVLHHAIRSGHCDLALELIAAEPKLSEGVNKHNESPMYIAVSRGFSDVSERLLKIPISSHVGTYGENALHAAVRNGNPGIAKKIVETRPQLAREENKSGNTPVLLAVLWNKLDVIRELLEHDRSLGYLIHTKDLYPLLVSAAYRGNVIVAQEILNYCPDAPYCKPDGWTILHEAVSVLNEEFVEFILNTPQLHKLINMRDKYGDTALHIAVRKCDPNIVRALLAHKAIDLTVLNNGGNTAEWPLAETTERAKTLNWNEVLMMMKKASPTALTFISSQAAKKEITAKSIEEIKSLTQTYTSNTSLIAILIATITFAAAFTLPGGYSNDLGSEGLPIMAKKIAFKVFLISDTLAMCSSLAVAFICILARWEDIEFLLYYRSFTKKLMWFAYMATTVAFAFGLYTVVAPHILWMAILICIVSVGLPFLTKLLGEWPLLKLRFRLGRDFQSDFLDMV
ncbi:ankyrin repeat family protein [Rhynchospora pubera]|uniref:Ankyrin repeat family protein n=1 Tax=Rhynchospora pubera TaxID=906938 RepID=A0AAV8FWW0_9POAL|nr:ankyrin repeat family protein [Rhynchospora pubera]